MAFAYFRDMHVDYAIIEVGLGGRLDSTNIITPVLSVITNISKDHTQFLGNTLEKIAGEKAGIIKPGVPVVIGDVDRENVMRVFQEKAREVNAPLYASTELAPLQSCELGEDNRWHFRTKDFGELTGELGGMVQARNASTVLTSVSVLREIGIPIPVEAVRDAFARVVELTGLMGRWQTVHTSPRVVCDTGHNTGGWEFLSRQLADEAKRCRTLRMVVGMVNDKDIDGVLSLMPKEAVYYFTQASIARALPVDEFAEKACRHGLKGGTYPNVGEAVRSALQDASEEDFIFVGGSTFIVADAYPLLEGNEKTEQ